MTDFEKAYQELNDEQRTAVDHIDGPLLVIAGPGTGKTQLLSIRVANILQQTDANPENILCLTFTETGAENMRQRLTSFIGPEAYKVQIQTYHAFGSYILQEHRPDLTQAIDELERFTIIREIQQSLPAHDILRPDYYTDAIISTISDLKSATLTPDRIRKIVATNQHDTDAIYEAIRDDIQATRGARYPKSAEIYGRICHTLKSFADQAPAALDGSIEPFAHVCYRQLATALETEANSTKPSSKLPGKWREKFFKKDRHDNYVFGDQIANQRLLSLANIMELYQQRLTSAGLFDYDDMILQAIQLLKENDDKRFDAQERFQYILLDEFQDTNDAQAELVHLLTDNPANDGQPNIMAVGDDDQAIYGFQGANTSNFFDFAERYHPEQVFLTKNYRSSAPILEFAHNIIEQANDRFCKSPNVAIDKKIVAAKPPSQTNIDLREFPAYQAEYSYIAEQIRQLLDSGVSGEEIAVIAPKHKYLMSILPYLHSEKILVSYTRRENILEHPQLLSLFNYCQILLAINQKPKLADPLWLQAMSMPCWQLSSHEILTLIEEARIHHQSILEALSASEQDKFKTIADFTIQLAGKIKNFSAEYIINAICAKLFSSADDYALFSHLNTLRDILNTKTKQNNSKLYLSDFCKLISDYQAAGLPILDKSPYHESDQAVHLQTVHSAKGLEYKHVFLIAADNQNWSEAKGNTDLVTLPRNLEHIRHTGDSADEKLRVFFVAITRAKAQLHLTYSLADFAGHHSERLKYLDIRNDVSQILPANFAQVNFDEHDDLKPGAIAPDKWFDNFLPDETIRRNLLLPRVRNFRLSPTHLNAFIDLAYANGPLEFYKRYILKLPSSTTKEITYGQLVHEIMDEINKENLDNDTATQRYIAKVAQSDTDETDRAYLSDRAADLQAFLTARGDQLRETTAESERSFFNETATVNGTPITGKIDRIEIDTKNKTIIVSDFKTGKPHHKWSDRDDTFKHKLQLYFYKFLLENSRDFRNYNVIGGRIDYIQPTDDGETISLELNFDETTATKVRQLIAAVYRHVCALDFPDMADQVGRYNATQKFCAQLLSGSDIIN